MKMYSLHADDGREFACYAHDKEEAKAKIALACNGRVNIIAVWEG